MRRISGWIWGWYTTLKIRFRNPELYRLLVSEFNPDDYVEVTRPERQ